MAGFRGTSDIVGVTCVESGKPLSNHACVDAIQSKRHLVKVQIAWGGVQIKQRQSNCDKASIDSSEATVRRQNRNPCRLP